MVNNSSENIMNIEQFNKYLSDINKLDSNSSVLLNELISQYPYFQTARILYLKSLHNQKNIKFEEELKITASYVNDRKILYRLLNDPFFLENEQISKKPTIEKEEIIEEKPLPVEKIEKIIVEEKPKLPIKEEKETVSPPPLTKKESKPEIKPVIKVTETEKIEKAVKVEPKPTEKIVAEKPKTDETKRTLADEILNKVTEIQKTRTTKYPTTEKESIADIILKKYNNKTSSTDKASKKPIVSKQKKKVQLEETKKEDKIPEKTLTKSVIKEKKKELLHFDFEKDTKEFKEEDLKIEEQIITKPYHINNFFELDTAETKNDIDTNKFLFTEWLEQIKSTKFKKDETKTFKEEKDLDIINRFISSDPSIQPLRDKLDYKYQQDITDSENDNDEEFITETLAGIYIKQKFYDKAISVYKKLILKYPEKNIYFANQIKKIKELIKNK